MLLSFSVCLSLRLLLGNEDFQSQGRLENVGVGRNKMAEFPKLMVDSKGMMYMISGYTYGGDNEMSRNSYTGVLVPQDCLHKPCDVSRNKTLYAIPKKNLTEISMSLLPDTLVASSCYATSNRIAIENRKEE
jgi:hypothetical protein